jgi:hypothetical protein
MEGSRIDHMAAHRHLQNAEIGMLVFLVCMYLVAQYLQRAPRAIPRTASQVRRMCHGRNACIAAMAFLVFRIATGN